MLSLFVWYCQAARTPPQRVMPSEAVIPSEPVTLPFGTEKVKPVPNQGWSADWRKFMLSSSIQYKSWAQGVTCHVRKVLDTTGHAELGSTQRSAERESPGIDD